MFVSFDSAFLWDNDRFYTRVYVLYALKFSLSFSLSLIFELLECSALHTDTRVLICFWHTASLFFSFILCFECCIYGTRVIESQEYQWNPLNAVFRFIFRASSLLTFANFVLFCLLFLYFLHNNSSTFSFHFPLFVQLGLYACERPIM